MRSVIGPPRVTLLADDLTGALDAAVPFAGVCLEVAVLLRPQEIDARVVVGDTESRGLSPQAAARGMEAWVKAAQGLVYKKMDSTLRGPFAAEANALARALGKRGVLVAPSFPRTGRTVRQGIVLVQGMPVHQTGFAADPGWPIADSRIAVAVRGQVGAESAHLGLGVVRAGAEAVAAELDRRTGFVVADAETDADLAVLARVVAERDEWLAVGSAGLAGALAHELRFAPAPVAATVPFPSVLVIGSLHPLSRTQMERLAQAAGLIPVVVAVDHDAEVPRRAVEDYHRAGMVLLTGPELRLPGGAAEVVRARLACRAAELVTRWGAKSLYATGGETLFAVLRELGLDRLRPLAEIAPGVVLSETRLAPGRQLRVISKAGGFGDEDLLVRLFGAPALWYGLG